MRSQLMLLTVFIVGSIACSGACNTPVVEDSALLPAPDGIDPASPNIERTTKAVDFKGIESIRLELPTARVDLSQAGGGQAASIKITEIIVREGMPHELLRDLLEGSAVTAERSFVDSSRLDVEATVADGLADADIVFDVQIVVPAGVSIEVLVGNGPVEVTDLVGHVEIRTQNGEVTINNVAGHVVAETTNRPISMIDVVGDVIASTTEGDISMRLSPGPAADITVENTTGDISLTIDRTTAASLSLTSVEGTVSANLSGFQVTDISTSEGLLEGVLNGGGGAIEVQSVSGTIEFVGK